MATLKVYIILGGHRGIALYFRHDKAYAPFSSLSSESPADCNHVAFSKNEYKSRERSVHRYIQSELTL